MSSSLRSFVLCHGVYLYGLRVSLTDFCDLHGLTIIPRFIFELLSVCSDTSYAS